MEKVFNITTAHKSKEKFLSAKTVTRRSQNKRQVIDNRLRNLSKKLKNNEKMKKN